MKIIQFALLTLGTAIAVLYIVLLNRGKKYDSLIQGLPDEGYSDKELFAAGYALEEFPVFGMSGSIGKKLMAQANILYPENNSRFAEYWARLYWARTLSLMMMVLSFSLCAATWFDGATMILILAFAGASAYVIYTQGVKEMENRLKRRAETCVLEFSNVVSKLAMLMSCGMIMKDAWRIVAQSKKGDVYDLMGEACMDMDNGRSAAEAIYNFGIRSSAQEIRKFSSVIIQNIEKGGADVTVFMRQQAEEMWSHRRQLMLQKGDEASAKLLVPTMLVLLGIIIIVMTAALSGISLSL